MKPAQIELSVKLDRLATRKEVRFAMRLSSQRDFKLACDDFPNPDTDSIGDSCDLSEDIMWLAIINGMPDTPSN